MTRPTDRDRPDLRCPLCGAGVIERTETSEHPGGLRVRRRVLVCARPCHWRETVTP